MKISVRDQIFQDQNSSDSTAKSNRVCSSRECRYFRFFVLDYHSASTIDLPCFNTVSSDFGMCDFVSRTSCKQSQPIKSISCLDCSFQITFPCALQVSDSWLWYCVIYVYNRSWLFILKCFGRKVQGCPKEINTEV